MGERDNRSERDREQRNSSGGNRSYYASTTSRPMSERSNAGGRSNNSSANYGEKSSSRDYNRREYSQIRSDSSADRIGSRSHLLVLVGTFVEEVVNMEAQDHQA